MNKQGRGGNADLIAAGIVALLGAFGPRQTWMESGFNLASLQWTEFASCSQEPMRALLAVFGS